MPKTELYIGNLAAGTRQRDIEDVFDKYGRLVRCDVKDKGFGPVYAFLEFEDERDAEDALMAENGKDLCGKDMVVEFAKGKPDRFSDRRGGDRDRYRGRDDYRGSYRGGGRSSDCYECGRPGHFARDCPKKRSYGRRDDRRDDRRERRRSRSHSRQRSRSPSYGRG